MSQREYFEACVLYFVKANVKKLGERGMSLDAVFHNTSFVKTNFGDNLFWILPGEICLMCGSEGTLVACIEFNVLIILPLPRRRQHGDAFHGEWWGVS